MMGWNDIYCSATFIYKHTADHASINIGPGNGEYTRGSTTLQDDEFSRAFDLHPLSPTQRDIAPSSLSKVIDCRSVRIFPSTWHSTIIHAELSLLRDTIGWKPVDVSTSDTECHLTVNHEKI
jgi:hypothetical protein